MIMLKHVHVQLFSVCKYMYGRTCAIKCILMMYQHNRQMTMPSITTRVRFAIQFTRNYIVLNVCT